MLEPILRQLASFLPSELCSALESLPMEDQKRLEELRIRVGCEVSAVIAGREEQPLSLGKPLIGTAALLRHLLNAATGYSAYAAGDALRQGFLPLPGGHRLGVCGTAVLEEDRVTTLKHLSSANLRIARQWSGCAGPVFERLGEPAGSLLIVGPPNSGKTTLLRDMIRQLSDRFGRRIGVVDSRGELTACLDGVPQLSVGVRTDILSLTPKDAGMEMLLRGMNPQWIALDEITAASDLDAMTRASYCGVRLLATAHAFDSADLRRRPLYRNLLELEIFQTLVILDADRRIRVEEVRTEC